MTDYIGISAYYHDSSVALIRDGKLKVFLKEESFTRVKGSSHFPIESLKYLINNFDINADSINGICFYEKPLRGWLSLLAYSLSMPLKRWKLTSVLLKKFWDGPLFIADEIKKLLPNSISKLVYCDHHLSHALCGLAYAEPKQDWLVIVIDGVGDGETFSVFTCVDGQINRVSSQLYPHSLGLFYSAITEYLGYSINDGEYKVMALASYGEPKYLDFMRDYMIMHKEDQFQLNMDYFDFDKNPECSFSAKLIDKFGPPARELVYPYEKETDHFSRFADVAASAQALTELVIRDTIIHNISLTGINNVVLSGGVAQNCKAISKLVELNEISELVVPPSPGDSGAALGAAIFACRTAGEDFIPEASIYPGHDPVFSDIFSRLFTLRYTGEDLCHKAAELLKNGEILATYIGSAEMGPRALGHRSLLCDASDEDTVFKLNSIIKKREDFRPLAPIILEKNAGNYFEINNKGKKNYSWMGCTSAAKNITFENYRSIIHVDGSARVQVVKCSDTDLISGILSKCDTLGIHILVNTSFNIAGDPIVFDDIDCYTNMSRMDLRWLITDNGIYERIDD